MLLNTFSRPTKQYTLLPVKQEPTVTKYFITFFLILNLLVQCIVVIQILSESSQNDETKSKVAAPSTEVPHPAPSSNKRTQPTPISLDHPQKLYVEQNTFN